MRSVEMRCRMRSLELRAIHSKYGINYDTSGAVDVFCKNRDSQCQVVESRQSMDNAKQ